MPLSGGAKHMPLVGRPPAIAAQWPICRDKCSRTAVAWPNPDLVGPRPTTQSWLFRGEAGDVVDHRVHRRAERLGAAMHLAQQQAALE